MSFIKRCLKKIDQKWRKRSAIKRMVKRCSQYMKPGWWHVESQYDKYVLKTGILPDQFTWKNLLRSLAFGIYRVSNQEPKAQCGKALSSPFENHKLFDEVNGKVYTVYSEAYWEKLMLFCDNMLPYFRTGILSVDKENHVVTEHYLQNAQEADLEKYFRVFCEQCKNYLTHIGIGNKTITAGYVKKIFDSENLPEDVRGYLDHIMNHITDYDVQYPVILCHNDVHVKNILTSNNEDFSLIDYELCGENVFFSDFMGLIFTSAVFLTEPSLYDIYVTGELDQQLAELFGVCGMVYDFRNREQYLFVFLLFRLYMIYLNRPYKLREYTDRMWAFFRRNGLCDVKTTGESE